jgi:hypothetical protein
MYYILKEKNETIEYSNLTLLVKDYILKIYIEQSTFGRTKTYSTRYFILHAFNSSEVISGYHIQNEQHTEKQIESMLQFIAALKVISGVEFNISDAENEIKEWYMGFFDSLLCKDIIE